jgi:hypothetical protein
MRVLKPGSKSVVCARRRKTVVLSAEAIRRLGTAATELDCDESAIVEQLISTHLGGYSIHVRGARFELKDRPAVAGEVSPPALSAG